jgi:hypothetical protein
VATSEYDLKRQDFGLIGEEVTKLQKVGGIAKID